MKKIITASMIAVTLLTFATNNVEKSPQPQESGKKITSTTHTNKKENGLYGIHQGTSRQVANTGGVYERF